MKAVQLKNVQLYHKEKVEPEVTFPDAHEALLSLIYLKTGLIFIKPENENHLLFPDNLREYHNFMQLLKSMDAVVDKTGKIVADKSLLKKNLNQFKHYFFESWVKQNLSSIHQEDLQQFMAEPVVSKNKLIYFKLMQYVEDVIKSMPDSIEQNPPKTTDNYRIKKDTPSYNVSLANVFEAMNQLDLQIEYKNMVGAIGVAYSIVAFELMYFSSNLHELYNGKVFEFSYVENRTYGLYGKDANDGVNIGLKLENLIITVSGEPLNLKTINAHIRDFLKNKNSNSGSQFNYVELLYLVFAYLVIYNGYHSSTNDADGTTLGKKFYERAVYFKQGRYTFAPSGVFYKILNLERVLELVLSEKIVDNIDIDSFGKITFNDTEENDNDKRNQTEVISRLLNVNTFSNLINVEHECKDVFKVWKLLVEASKSKDILPYASFEVLKSLSDAMLTKSISKYRKSPIESIERFKGSYWKENESKSKSKGFVEDLLKNYSEINERCVSQLHFKSPLNYYLEQYKKFSAVFELLNDFNFQIDVVTEISDILVRLIAISNDNSNLTKSFKEEIGVILNKLLDAIEKEIENNNSELVNIQNMVSYMVSALKESKVTKKDFYSFLNDLISMLKNYESNLSPMQNTKNHSTGA